MISCADCGVPVGIDDARVYLTPDGVCITLCPGCSAGRPGNRVYRPRELPEDNRSRVTGGRDAR